MTDKHTEEPWVLSRICETAIEGKDGRHVCSTGGFSDNRVPDGGHGENEANARRIIALQAINAELLAALEDIATEKPSLSGPFPGDPYLYGCTAHKRARAAIAKAKGETS